MLTYADCPMVRDGGCRQPEQLWSFSNEFPFPETKSLLEFVQATCKSMRRCRTAGREPRDDAQSGSRDHASGEAITAIYRYAPSMRIQPHRSCSVARSARRCADCASPIMQCGSENRHFTTSNLTTQHGKVFTERKERFLSCRMSLPPRFALGRCSSLCENKVLFQHMSCAVRVVNAAIVSSTVTLMRVPRHASDRREPSLSARA